MCQFFKNIITLALIAISVLATAQGKQAKRTAIQHITGESFIYYYQSLDGVPFYEEDWHIGSVTLNSGETYENLQLRYDDYKDELIYRNDDNNNVTIIDKSSVLEFTLVNKKGKTELFKSITSSKLKELNNHYFAFILEDSITVIKKYEAKEEKYSNANPTLKKTGRFVQKQNTYTWNQQELKSVPKIRRIIYRQYPEFKSDIRKFVIHNHIHMKNEDDVKNLYQEINRLIKEK